MNLALIVNQTKPEAESFQKIIEEELAKKGISPKIFLNKDFSREDLVVMDCLITLGGDGTILHTTGVLQGMPVPILGINAGHLGYLTEIRQRRRIAEAIDRLVAGDYVEDRRAMLSGSIFRQGKEIFSRSALNELLLSRVRGVSIHHFQVFCDGMEMVHYSADGIIISTPTGSTAYNLSAGGPIISPEAPVYIMNPICAHSLNARAVVLDNRRTLEIVMEGGDQVLSFDGEAPIELLAGDVVRIRKAKEETVLIKFSKESFLHTLREKMANL